MNAQARLLRLTQILMLCLVVALLGLPLEAKSSHHDHKRTKPAVVSPQLKAHAKKWDISISQQFKHDRIAGAPVVGAELERELGRFFECLEFLPRHFIKRSGIDKVVILDNLTLNGKRIGGVASGNVMFLAKGFSRHAFYHELFHIFDDTGKTNRQWCKLNPKDFVYKGSDFYSAHLKKKEAKKVKKDAWMDKMRPHFVSEYAMSFECEDRAETFAAMVTEGRNFLRRTAHSTVLQKKMKMIIDMTDSKRLMGHDFWKRRLASNPLE